jgi:hypothetical protein
MPNKVSRSNSNPAKCWLRLVPKSTADSKQVAVPSMQSRTILRLQISPGKLNSASSFVVSCTYAGVGLSCGLQEERSCKPGSGVDLFEAVAIDSSPAPASSGQTGKEGMAELANANAEFASMVNLVFIETIFLAF